MIASPAHHPDSAPRSLASCVDLPAVMLRLAVAEEVLVPWAAACERLHNARGRLCAAAAAARTARGQAAEMDLPNRDQPGWPEWFRAAERSGTALPAVRERAA